MPLQKGKGEHGGMWVNRSHILLFSSFCPDLVARSFVQLNTLGTSLPMYHCIDKGPGLLQAKCLIKVSVWKNHQEKYKSRQMTFTENPRIIEYPKLEGTPGIIES